VKLGETLLQAPLVQAQVRGLSRLASHRNAGIDQNAGVVAQQRAADAQALSQVRPGQFMRFRQPLHDTQAGGVGQGRQNRHIPCMT
jgi:hypothetical protein